jgi:hypothetical protein
MRSTVGLTQRRKVAKENLGVGHSSVRPSLIRLPICVLRLLCVFASLRAIAFTSPALGQEPELTGILPAGGQRGTTATLRIDGKNLAGSKLFVSGRGVSILSVEPTPAGDAASIKLSIAADAPLGPREIRIGTEKGVSNPVNIWLDVFPEITEAEPNDDLPHAQKLNKTPVIINGRIQADKDRDFFTFDTKAGESWVFDCVAARIHSRLDPVIELHDSAGQLIKMAQSTWESDPRLIYKFVKAGRYTVTIRDTQFLGGPQYVYRLAVGVIPVVTAFTPRGERPGRVVELQAEGVNLGNNLRAGVAIPADAPLGEYWTTAVTGLGPSLLFPIILDNDLVAGITETDANMPLPLLPGALDGIFQKYPRIKFFLQAGPSDHLIFDLLGRRIGSRIDGALRITNAAGKELAVNDDAVGKDARLEFTPPTEGIYNIEARNVEEKTGPDCFYRLVVHRVEPDFRLTLNVDRTAVGIGGVTALPISVERLRGFNGPITLTAEGLPAGVTFSGGTVEPGQNSIEVTFAAAAGIKPEPALFHIRGEATVNGQKLTHEAIPRYQYLPRSIDPGMFTDDSYRKPYQEAMLLPIGVIPSAQPFSISLSQETLTLAPGQKVEVIVKVARKPGAEKDITLEVRNLPAKVTVAAPPIPASATEGRVIFTAAADATAAIRNIIIQGKQAAVVAIAPAIRLQVKR